MYDHGVNVENLFGGASDSVDPWNKRLWENLMAGSAGLVQVNCLRGKRQLDAHVPQAGNGILIQPVSHSRCCTSSIHIGGWQVGYHRMYPPRPSSFPLQL
jgi:hypothetical protein